MLLLLTEWHTLSMGNVPAANSDMIHGELVISLHLRVSSHMSTGDVTTADRVALHIVYW